MYLFVVLLGMDTNTYKLLSQYSPLLVPPLPYIDGWTDRRTNSLPRPDSKSHIGEWMDS